MKKYLVAGLLFLMLCLSGCIIRSPEELYSLPRQSDAYNDLQSAIDAVMVEGVQYSSPLTGTNRQPVQMSDLDGDGLDEAVVFLKTGGELPLKAYIFDRVGNSFQNVYVIEGDGSAFAQVEYAQLDGKLGQEMIIGRQLSDQVLQSIGAYSFADGQPVELLSSSYSEMAITDIDDNGNRDLFLMRFVSEGRSGIAELYRCVDGVMEREPELSLSVGVGSIRNIHVGTLTGKQSAIFVAGVLSDASIITDIFCVVDGEFMCISSTATLNLHANAVRGYNVLASDIDDDGIVEIPNVVRLPSASPEDDPYYVISWMEYKPETDELILKATTYHHYSGGWYFRLPERIGTQLMISRGKSVSGVQGLTFSAAPIGDQPSEELFTIYAFTGSNRTALSTEDGRFQLSTKSDTCYSVSLGEGAEKWGVTQAELLSMFHYIRVDWNSGET